MADTAAIDRKNQGDIAELNRRVRERLHADPSVQVLCRERLELFGVPLFFGDGECERLMAMIDEVARPSPTFDEGYGRTHRTSFSGDMDPNDPFVKMLHRRMDDLLGVDDSFGETMQGQRYQPGQEFKAHHDWFDTTQPYWTPEVARGGQRSWTLMVYLNAVEAGGNTDFTRVDLSIPPQRGTLIAWNNALEDGSPNPDTLHAGTPVERGVKYVITRWYRGRKWY